MRGGDDAFLRPHRRSGSYAGHVRVLERWLERRIAWLDRHAGRLG